MKDEKIDKDAVETATATAEEAPQTPTGRAAILEAFRAENPDIEGDPDDEALYGYAHERYNKLSGANSKIAELVAKDPRAGLALSMLVGEGKSLPFAVGSVYGKDWQDGDLEEFEAGYQENLKRLAESDAQQEEATKNFQESLSKIGTFVKDNGLTEEQAAQLTEAIYADAENLLMGIIPVEYIEYKWKGINYDKDVEEAAATGYVEGKNEAIDIKKKKVAAAPLPDLASGSGTGKPRPTPKPQKRGSFFDEFDKEQS